MFFANEQSGESGQWTISFKRLARKAFLEDWPMKLIALVVSLALWLIVSGETGKGTLTVPLNLRTAENTEFSNTPVQEVEIEVTGDKRKIDRLAEIKGALAIYRDLTDLPVGDSVIDLNPANVRIDLPAGVRLTDIRPGQDSGPAGSNFGAGYSRQGRDDGFGARRNGDLRRDRARGPAKDTRSRTGELYENARIRFHREDRCGEQVG